MTDLEQIEYLIKHIKDFEWAEDYKLTTSETAKDNVVTLTRDGFTSNFTLRKRSEFENRQFHRNLTQDHSKVTTIIADTDLIRYKGLPGIINESHRFFAYYMLGKYLNFKGLEIEPACGLLQINGKSDLIQIGFDSDTYSLAIDFAENKESKEVIALVDNQSLAQVIQWVASIQNQAPKEYKPLESRTFETEIELE